MMNNSNLCHLYAPLSVSLPGTDVVATYRWRRLDERRVLRRRGPLLGLRLWMWVCVSVCVCECVRWHTHALVLTNSTAAGFQSADPKDPTPPPQSLSQSWSYGRSVRQTHMHKGHTHTITQCAVWLDRQVLMQIYWKHLQTQTHPRKRAATWAPFPQILFALIRLQSTQIRRSHAHPAVVCTYLRASVCVWVSWLFACVGITYLM